MKWLVIAVMASLISLLIYHLIMGILTADKVDILLDGRRRKNPFINIIAFTEQTVNESNIKYYIENYNSYYHFSLALACFFITYSLVRDYPLEFRILLSLVVFQLPWIILQFVKVRTTTEIKKQILDLLISYKAYYILTQDIFQTFKLLEDNLAEPVNGIVKVLNKQYSVTKREGEKCLETFKRRFSDLKMRMFVEQLILAFRTGGDVKSICSKFIEDMSKYEEIEDREKLDALSDRYGLYFIVLLNIGVMHYMMKSNYVFVRFVSYNLIGKTVLILDYLLCIYLLLKLIKEG